MNQETDQVSANGPGTMTQLAARDFLTDKSPDTTAEPPAQAPAGRRGQVEAQAQETRGRRAERKNTDDDHIHGTNGIQRPDDRPRRPAGRPGRLLRDRQRENGRHACSTAKSR